MEDGGIEAGRVAAAAGWGVLSLIKQVVNLKEVTSDGLITSVAPLPANEVSQEHDEDEARQSCSDDDGDQHVVFVQLALLS